jgi:acetoin utilization deacetylase AcuC-like enzyme
MNRPSQIPVFFNPEQKKHNPVYEWAFGKKLQHPESTKRIQSILSAIEASSNNFSMRVPAAVSLELIHQVHDERLSQLYETAAKELERGKTFYPSVFFSKNTFEANPLRLSHTGAFCFDSGTPLTKFTQLAAQGSVASANEASLLIERGESPFAYALCRPPGHHASKSTFGGYCYYNNAGVVAHRLRDRAKVAIIDIDFHHGNGTQDLFYEDDRVFFISVHGDPGKMYPYFSGFSGETGKGAGLGFNQNIPLPKGVDGQEYLRILDEQVIPAVKKFAPDYLILSAGFDTFKLDPIGNFALETDDYAELAARFARLGLPTLILQEGGYSVQELGLNVVTFLKGFRDQWKSHP